MGVSLWCSECCVGKNLVPHGRKFTDELLAEVEKAEGVFDIITIGDIRMVIEEVDHYIYDVIKKKGYTKECRKLEDTKCTHVIKHVSVI